MRVCAKQQSSNSIGSLSTAALAALTPEMQWVPPQGLSGELDLKWLYGPSGMLRFVAKRVSPTVVHLEAFAGVREDVDKVCGISLAGTKAFGPVFELSSFIGLLKGPGLIAKPGDTSAWGTAAETPADSCANGGTESGQEIAAQAGVAVEAVEACACTAAVSEREAPNEPAPAMAPVSEARGPIEESAAPGAV